MFIFSRTTNGEQQPRRRMGCLSGCLVFFLIYFACSAILGWIMGDAFATSKVVTLENNTIYRLKMDAYWWSRDKKKTHSPLSMASYQEWEEQQAL